ncbi:AAA family ATPase [Noviherbaspirillum sp. 1P10PC]|uniref:AAA family ATPase n=1 Tax=Noviherbaspirillum sp. 1P10PC TaxID=3132292 RepID=UPI00399F5363
MSINFKVLEWGARASGPSRNLVQLVPDNWDDYSFKTTFEVVFFDAEGKRIDLGTVKIGYRGQPHGWTLHAIPKLFDYLPIGWFSLGQDVDYYRSIHEKLSPEEKAQVLRALGDIVASDDVLEAVQNEDVFSTSLMRSVSLSVIYGQFRRVLAGQVVLTDFRFGYRDPGDERHAAVNLEFQVDPASKPSTNIHVLIGRNGVGKTTLLNNMVSAIFPQADALNARWCFVQINQWGRSVPLPDDYFSSVVSVSFSAFDPFVPPADQPDRSRGVAYFYVGMKQARSGSKVLTPQPPKTDADLANDFIESLQSCFSQPAKRDRWLAAITRLESDTNFADMSLGRLLEMDNEAAILAARALVNRMSSGHSIVLLTITKLVDTVEEKTLVLMDEPESHLHPPLLSAFTRALSDLLHNRNGVAIIATHSPVVVQEVPKSCVWKLTRLRTQGRADRPEGETFGENVGVLTREIFGLEVTKSGFHDELQQAVNEGGTFDSILKEYKGQLGFEAQAILRTLVRIRDDAIIRRQ